jgi:hypothetical protein
MAGKLDSMAQELLAVGLGNYVQDAGFHLDGKISAVPEGVEEEEEEEEEVEEASYPGTPVPEEVRCEVQGTTREGSASTGPPPSDTLRVCQTPAQLVAAVSSAVQKLTSHALHLNRELQVGHFTIFTCRPVCTFIDLVPCILVENEG